MDEHNENNMQARSVIKGVNADPVYATQVFDTLGVHPVEISHDLAQVRKASDIVSFFKGFDNGISAIRSVVKGVPVKDRLAHLGEYVDLKREELSVRDAIERNKMEMKGSDNARENKILEADLKAQLKKLQKDLKFYER